MEKTYISFDEIKNYVNDVVNHINNSGIKFKNVYGLPRGGLTPAVMLSHKLGIPLISDKKDITLDTLIVDEIIDKGNTILKHNLQDNYVVSLTLRYTSKFIPKFYAKKINDDSWLVLPWEEF